MKGTLMLNKSLLLFLFIFAYLNAFAETQITKSNEPISFGLADKENGLLGLKFTPPDEKDWITKRTGAEVSIKKNGTTYDVNSEIEGYLIRLDTPIEPISGYIEQIKRNTVEEYSNHPKLKLEHVEVNQDADRSLCVIVHLLLQGKKDTNWHSEQYVLSCGFSKYRGMGAEVRYYDRYYDPIRDSQLAEKAHKIFKSVVIAN